MRFGDGWIPWLVTREELPGCMDYIREQPGFAECADRFEVVMPLQELSVEDYSHKEIGETELLSDREEILEEIGLLKEAGTTVVQVVPPRTESFEALLDWIAWFSEDISPVYRS